MREAETDTHLNTIVQEAIPRLSVLYDRFAHAIDPFDPACDEAERKFMEEVIDLYECLRDPRPSLQVFRKGVIRRCRDHLSATRKNSTV